MLRPSTIIQIHGVQGNPLCDIAQKLNLRLAGESHEMDAYLRGTRLPSDLSAKLAENLHSTFFEISREYAQQHADPPSTQSLAAFILNQVHESLIYDGLKNDQDRECVERLMRGFTAWCGADLNQVSLRYWGFGEFNVLRSA